MTENCGPAETPETLEPPPSSGGWGSLKAVTTYLVQKGVTVAGTAALMKQNKADGFMCVSCAWAKPRQPHAAEFGENGAKAAAWKMTSKRRTPEFFTEHTLTKLEGWSDLDLEAGGRLTAPLRYDAASDKYVETTWKLRLQTSDPNCRNLYRSPPCSTRGIALRSRPRLSTSFSRGATNGLHVGRYQ